MTTSAELNLLRSQPHSEQLYLSFYQPTTLFSAQVASGTSQGSRLIPYYNASGTYTNVFHDATLLVGSTPGASNLGRIRIRSVDGSNFTVAENYDIPWQFGQYLTAINYIDLNPIYPRIISGTASNGDPVIFYKDYDIAYTNQNVINGALPCAGPHRAAFISGSSASLYWDASGTNHVNGESMTYSWVFEGGSPGTYSGQTPGYVNYSTPGHYKTTLTIVGSGGSSDVTYRFVSIYPRASNGDAIPPIQRWSAASLQGSRAEGGYSIAFKVYDQTSQIYDGALVILFADQTSYGNTKATVGSNIKFVGYVEKGTIVYDYQTSSVEFTAVSAAEYLKSIEAFSISCNDASTPQVWYQIQNMSITKALYHYLKWHTTVLDCTDFIYNGDNRIFQFFDTNRDSIYDAINNFLKNGIIGEIGCDRLGRIWTEVSPGAIHNVSSVLPVNMSVTKQDWMGEPSIEEQITKQYSCLELGGVVYYGMSAGTGTSQAILCIAPGEAPGARGKMESIEGFIATSQAEINNVAGDYWAYQNYRYSVTMKMAGNYNNIDIFPAQQCLLNISGSDTNRGIYLGDSPFHPSQVDWVIDTQHSYVYPQVKFSQLTNGMKGQTEAVAAAQTVPIPVVPPIPSIPPLPAIPPISLPFLGGGRTYTWVIGNPAIGSIPGPHLPGSMILSRLDCAAIGSQVSFNIDQRAAPGTPGSSLFSSDIVADSNGETSIAFTTPVLIANNWLWLSINNVVTTTGSSTTGSSGQFVVTLATAL
jgi:hypothetical protein